MPLTLSERALAISPSVTLVIDARAKQLRAEGMDVIGFSAGEPDFCTPEYINDAGKFAIDAGITRYTPVAGTLDLRQKICEKFHLDNGVDYTPAEVIVSSGAKQSIFTALSVLLNPGDEVLIQDPQWLNYVAQVRYCGGEAVRVPTDLEHNFTMQPEAIEQRITPRTKALMINSPNNPTGSVMSRADMEQIAAIAKKHDLLIIADEVYNTLLYGTEPYLSIAELPGMKDRCVVINSFSKSYAMTGWRIGYLAGPAEIVDRMTKCQENFNACANAIGQYAAVAALDHPELCTQLRDIFARRRTTLLEGLAAIPGMNSNDPTGAFYVFADIRAFGMSSEDFCNRLLDEERVVCIPGSAFGACGEGFVRIAYTCSDADLTEAIARIRRFCAKYYTA